MLGESRGLRSGLAQTVGNMRDRHRLRRPLRRRSPRHGSRETTSAAADAVRRAAHPHAESLRMAVEEVVRGMSTSMSCSSRCAGSERIIDCGLVRYAQPRHARHPELPVDARALERRGCRPTNGERTVGRVALMTAERVADLIGEPVWRGMSRRLVDAFKSDTPDLVMRPGVRRGNGRITARRRTRGTHPRCERGSNGGLLRVSGRWLEAPDA
jgi:hypothetical protein